MSNNVHGFRAPPPPPELLVGPFEEWRVTIEGRVIPRLTGFVDGDGICLVVDRRFACTVPKYLAHSVAYVIANALAVGAGYPWFGADNKDQPFTPRGGSISGADLG